MADQRQKSRDHGSSQTVAQPGSRGTREDPGSNIRDISLMRRLGHYLRPYWVQATVSTIAITLKSFSEVSGPIMVMVAIDRYFGVGAKSSDVTTGSVAQWLAHTSPLARVLPDDPYRGITALAGIYLGLLLLGYLFEFTQIYLMQWTGQKLMFDMRSQIFRHMQRMHIGFFDTHPVGRLVTRLTSDVDAINEMFTAGALAIVDDFFNLTVMAIVMFTIKWWLALLAFAVLPLILVVTRLFRDHVRESFRRVRAAIARINSFTQEHVSGMSVVQLFNHEEKSFKDFEAVNRQHMIAFKDTIFAYALYYPAVELLSAIAIALVIWRGGFGVLSGSVTIGMLAMFIQYSQRFWRPIQDLSDKYNIIQAAMAACERIFRLLDTKPEIVSPARPLTGDGSNRIEFRHVWFTYQKLTEEQRAAVAAITGTLPPEKVGDDLAKDSGSGANGDSAEQLAALQAAEIVEPVEGTAFSPYLKQAEKSGALDVEGSPQKAAAAQPSSLASLDGIEWILKDVSFTVEPGHTVAIVGHTGAGKTTLTSLMMRFYDVTAGQILLDGVDLRQQDLKALRRHFAVVLQDPFLFTGTIAENIRLGNEQISEADLLQAACDVNVLDFIESLSGGFDEQVQERGNSLSTGQKQLINFARALAYNPHILILDEATSSVDTDTELRIRSALERMVEGRTSVLIAHRLSTIQRADTILVMHKGQLREMGSHQQLLAQRGLYWKLYQLQYKDQENGAFTSHAAAARN
jgi:ATP-binding cassette, subfamily B, multidrug efflux pump